MRTFLSSFLKKEYEAFSSFIFGRFLSSFIIQRTGGFVFYCLRKRKQYVVVSLERIETFIFLYFQGAFFRILVSY
jgi:hypothetical protein